MKHKEKYLIYIWLGSLLLIISIGIILCFQRPPTEIIKAGQDLFAMSEKIRSFYRNRPDYWGLDVSTAIKQKLFEGSISENKIVNNLGKEVVIGGDHEGSQIMPGTRSFMITYKNLSKQECVELSVFRGQEPDKLGLISMSIQNEKGIYNFSWGNKGLPLLKSQAKKYCEDENSVIWSFE